MDANSYFFHVPVQSYTAALPSLASVAFVLMAFPVQAASDYWRGARGATAKTRGTGLLDPINLPTSQGA